MKKQILLLVTILIFSSCLAQSNKSVGKLKIRNTPTAASTDNILAKRTNGLVVDTGVPTSVLTGLNTSIPSLQEVTDEGSTTTNNITIDNGINSTGRINLGTTKEAYIDWSFGTPAKNKLTINSDGTVQINSDFSSIFLDGSGIGFNSQNIGVSGSAFFSTNNITTQTRYEMPETNVAGRTIPLSVNGNFADVDGEITLPTTTGGALEVTDEGNGDGIVISGRDAANYGNIGNNAMDLSVNLTASTTHGATGSYSFATGTGNTASGIASTALGYENQASGQMATVLGRNNTASGTSSVCIGAFNAASGGFSFALGNNNTSSGTSSFALGFQTDALSYGEFVHGRFNTIYTPSSAGIWQNGDRLFVIANGVDSSNRSDALTVLKNGNTSIGIDNFEANDTGEKLQVNGTIKATDINFTGLVVFADDASAGVGGLVAGDVYRTATGELRIKL